MSLIGIGRVSGGKRTVLELLCVLLKPLSAIGLSAGASAVHSLPVLKNTRRRTGGTIRASPNPRHRVTAEKGDRKNSLKTMVTTRLKYLISQDDRQSPDTEAINAVMRKTVSRRKTFSLNHMCPASRPSWKIAVCERRT